MLSAGLVFSLVAGCGVSRAHLPSGMNGLDVQRAPERAALSLNVLDSGALWVELPGPIPSISLFDGDPYEEVASVWLEGGHIAFHEDLGVALRVDPWLGDLQFLDGGSLDELGPVRPAAENRVPTRLSGLHADPIRPRWYALGAGGSVSTVDAAGVVSTLRGARSGSSSFYRAAVDPVDGWLVVCETDRESGTDTLVVLDGDAREHARVAAAEWFEDFTVFDGVVYYVTKSVGVGRSTVEGQEYPPISAPRGAFERGLAGGAGVAVSRSGDSVVASWSWLARRGDPLPWDVCVAVYRDHPQGLVAPVDVKWYAAPMSAKPLAIDEATCRVVLSGHPNVVWRYAERFSPMGSPPPEPVDAERTPPPR